MAPSRLKAVFWAVLVAYGVVMAALVGAVPGGSDTSGYFNEAHLFSHFRIHEATRALPGVPADAAPPYLYVPLGFRPAPGAPAVLVPTYPPGLSLMLVPAAWVAGWSNSGDVVLVLHSLAGLVLLYILGREFGLRPVWAFAGSAILAASPLYIFMSLWAMSDVPAMVWATAAAIAAWKCRSRIPWAFAAGLCAGVGFLIRPSNFLMALPMLILIGWSPRRLLLAALGGLPCIAAWMAINHAAYGSFLQSGYGAIGGEFHRELIAGTIQFCIRWMPVAVSPVVIIAPLVVAVARSRTRVTLSLIAWICAYVAFYAPYRWTHENWWFLRFLLPAVPALLVAGLLGAQSLLDLLKGRINDSARVWALGFLFAAAVWTTASQINPLHAWSIGFGERKYGRIGEWLRTHVPENAALIAMQYSGSDYYFSHNILIRADELDAATAARIRAAARAEGRDVYAVIFPNERDFIGKLPGKWTQLGAVDDVTIWSNDWNSPGS
jgi:hypothetical protein